MPPHPQPILYAEDNSDDVYFMQHAFAKAGVINQLVTVSDGQQAIDYLSGEGVFTDREKNPLPCLLLLDLGLPIKNGFEVLQWLRAESVASLKVVVVSASGQQLDIDLAKKMGIIDYIVKPNPPTALAKILRERMGQWLTKG